MNGQISTQASAWERIERWVVVLVAAHSYGVFLGLMFLTEWSASVLGFEEVSPLFFARQAGAFHFVVATAYLIEQVRYGGVSILVTTKAVAVAFLFAMCLVESVSWAVPASMVSDGVMGLVVLLVHRRRRRLASSGSAL